ncbi:MAG: metal-dependent hydrolase, partial [Alphaproteobacteria bacterium]
MTQKTNQARANFDGPVEIKARNMNFEKIKDVNMHNWHSGNPIISQFFNAMSLTFPDGEDMFVHSVRLHANVIDDPKLKAHAKGFMTQEAIHSREHELYNDAMLEQGIPGEGILEFQKKGNAWARKKINKAFLLSGTAAAEHFTAALADLAFTDPRFLGEKSDPYMRRLWHWHAVEETEHKAVAYDVYKKAYPGLKGYAIRATTMFLNLLTMMPGMIYGMFVLLKGLEEKPTGKQWREALSWAFGTGGGFMWKIHLLALPYFKPSFHPWDEQNFHY